MAQTTNTRETIRVPQQPHHEAHRDQQQPHRDAQQPDQQVSQQQPPEPAPPPYQEPAAHQAHDESRVGPPTSRGGGRPESEAERRERAAREEKETRDRAEAATAHLPRPGEPAQAGLTACDVAQEGERWVKMNFPAPVTLTLPGYRMVRFDAGVQDVPESLSRNEYLLAHGATLV